MTCEAISPHAPCRNSRLNPGRWPSRMNSWTSLLEAPSVITITILRLAAIVALSLLIHADAEVVFKFLFGFLHYLPQFELDHAVRQMKIPLIMADDDYRLVAALQAGDDLVIKQLTEFQV